jgi:hypothetical protein
MLPESVSVLMLVVDIFERLQVPYLIGGSMASALYGVTRSTLMQQWLQIFIKNKLARWQKHWAMIFMPMKR